MFFNSWQSFTGWANQTWQSTTTFFNQPFQTATTFLGQSINSATTTAMQGFSSLASLGQSASQAWTGLNLGGGPFFDASQGFHQSTYRETFTSGGLTQTFQSTSFTPLSRSALPPELLLASFQAGLQQVGAFTQPVSSFLLADAGRDLRVAGRVLQEFGYPMVGRMVGVGGLTLDTGGTGRTIGLAVGGTLGSFAGRIFFGPVGGVLGGYFVGDVLGRIGSAFDDPFATQLR